MFHQSKHNSWSNLLHTGETFAAPKLESRIPASVKTRFVEKEKKHTKSSAEESSPDFDALMKELKNVSPDHNEVY